MDDAVVIVDYDEGWPGLFREVAEPIRAAMGDVALRIDHIGSTAIVGIGAKPIIDILISVESFEPFEAIRRPMEGLGYVWQADNPDLTKRFFREAPHTRRTHIHVHKIGTWQQQLVLVFRDFLRADVAARNRYEAVKRELAAHYRDERSKYVVGKEPIIWETLAAATKWVQMTGWEAGPSDA
jgi:GrpB-like predicted nucleotidyltransferase (UPF0157 family)